MVRRPCSPTPLLRNQKPLSLCSIPAPRNRVRACPSGVKEGRQVKAIKNGTIIDLAAPTSRSCAHQPRSTVERGEWSTENRRATSSKDQRTPVLDRGCLATRAPVHLRHSSPLPSGDRRWSPDIVSSRSGRSVAWRWYHHHLQRARVTTWLKEMGLVRKETLWFAGEHVFEKIRATYVAPKGYISAC